MPWWAQLLVALLAGGTVIDRIVQWMRARNLSGHKTDRKKLDHGALHADRMDKREETLMTRIEKLEASRATLMDERIEKALLHNKTVQALQSLNSAHVGLRRDYEMLEADHTVLLDHVEACEADNRKFRQRSGLHFTPAKRPEVPIEKLRESQETRIRARSMAPPPDIEIPDEVEVPKPEIDADAVVDADGEIDADAGHIEVVELEPHDSKRRTLKKSD